MVDHASEEDRHYHRFIRIHPLTRDVQCECGAYVSELALLAFAPELRRLLSNNVAIERNRYREALEAIKERCTSEFGTFSTDIEMLADDALNPTSKASS